MNQGGRGVLGGSERMGCRENRSKRRMLVVTLRVEEMRAKSLENEWGIGHVILGHDWILMSPRIPEMELVGEV